MKVNTRYSIGDTVWKVLDNRVVRLTIDGVLVITNEFGTVIKYSVSGTGNERYYETELFTTKKELLTYLKNYED